MLGVLQVQRGKDLVADYEILTQEAEIVGKLKGRSRAIANRVGASHAIGQAAMQVV